MNYKEIKALLRLQTFIFESKNPKPTRGTLEISESVDNEVKLDLNGGFRRLRITFTGNVFINNIFPDGFYTRMSTNTITIDNLLLKTLKQNILFTYEGNMIISKAYIITAGGEKILLTIKNNIQSNSIENTETQFEDNTILLLEESAEPINETTFKRGVLRPEIRGLYSNRAFKDGYSGYYNYHPKENVYMTGKQVTNNSKAIGVFKKSPKLEKKKERIQKVLSKSLNQPFTRDSNYKDIDRSETKAPRQINQKQQTTRPQRQKVRAQQKTRTQQRTKVQQNRERTKDRGTGGSY
jgi:hypothetical protein